VPLPLTLTVSVRAGAPVQVAAFGLYRLKVMVPVGLNAPLIVESSFGTTFGGVDIAGEAFVTTRCSLVQFDDEGGTVLRLRAIDVMTIERKSDQ